MISICIPTYEQQGYGAKYLTELLKSIQAQIIQCEYEIIVSDNATDGSIKAVVDSFDLPIHYHFNPERGASENINNAISLANGDKVKIMCQDDIFLTRNAIDVFNKELDRYGWVVSNSKHINDRSTPTGQRIPQYNHGNFGENTVGMPSVTAFRKTAARFNTKLKTVCDMYFYYELFMQYGSPGVIRQFLIGQRFHNASLSRNQPSYHQKDVNYLIRNGMIPGSLPKVVIVVVVYNRLHNLVHWIKCWKQCDQEAELVIIHNDNGEDWSEYCEGYRYIKRPNIGYDIGAFQDVCRKRIKIDYDYLLWCTDDTVPMAKDFVSRFIDSFNRKTGVVCMHCSTEITPHIRTTGFCIHKSLADRLIFPHDPITTKEHCWQFEYKNRDSFINQVLRNRLKVQQVSHLYDAPLWDIGYQDRNKNARLLVHLLDRTKEHEKTFNCEIYTTHKLPCMQRPVNVLSELRESATEQQPCNLS